MIGTVAYQKKKMLQKLLRHQTEMMYDYHPEHQTLIEFSPFKIRAYIF